MDSSPKSRSKLRVAIFFATIMLLGVFAFVFLHVYESSPGYTTQEIADRFYATKPTCYGLEFLLNPIAIQSDSAGRSLCIGVLK